jgi:hypothetical protein
MDFRMAPLKLLTYFSTLVMALRFIGIDAKLQS